MRRKIILIIPISIIILIWVCAIIKMYNGQLIPEWWGRTYTICLCFLIGWILGDIWRKDEE